MTRLHQLAELKQSIWLDHINRSLIESGALKKWIDDGLRGMTSNPSIFNQVISQGSDYDPKILKLKEAGKSTFEIYDELTIRDIQDACDLFEPVYKTTRGLDGYVSLEINPELADDTDASIQEGRRLFKKVGRPNVMIKVPATQAGFSVIEELLADGINVNVTLIFSLKQYEETAQAFLKGLERLSKKTKDLSAVASVASVFVSRVDSAIDDLLDKKNLPALKGKAAVANCKLILERSRELFAGSVFKTLASQGAKIQRVLWGSTSTKNSAYSDVKYVAELIAPDTINTVPEKTLKAFMDHGTVKAALQGDAREAREIIASLRAAGIDSDAVCLQLLDDGVAAFEKAFAELMQSLKTKASQLCPR